MSAPHKCSGMQMVQAHCHDCGWEAYTRNAMGLAAQHAKRHGHHVTCEQGISVSWNCTFDHPRDEAKAP